MKSEYIANISSDTYSGWDAKLHTEYYVETEKGEDIQDILKPFDGKKVKITIEAEN